MIEQSALRWDFRFQPLPDLFRALHRQSYLSDLPGLFHRQAAHDLLDKRDCSWIHTQFIQPQTEQKRESQRFTRQLAANTDPLSPLVGSLN